MYLFQRIEEVMMQHNDARRAVGEFILHEKDNLYHYTIQEIADITYTSKATVVRFAKAMGYDGWKEFMKAFVTELQYEQAHQSNVDVNYPFKEKDSTETIIENIKTLQMEAIQDTADQLDISTINHATNMLIRAKHIVIFGLSPNIFLGELFRRKLITIGKQIDIANPGESGIISRTLTSQDCAIMISYSGNNEHAEPITHMKELVKNKVPILGITSGGDNYVHQHADCVLSMSSRERLYTKISNFATEESLGFILNVLFSCYFARNYQDNCKFKIESSKVLERSRQAILMEMKDEENTVD